MSMSFSDNSPSKAREERSMVRNNTDISNTTMRSPKKMNLSRTDLTPKVNLVESTPMSNKTMFETANKEKQFFNFAQKINNLNTVPIMEENEGPSDVKSSKAVSSQIEVQKRRLGVNREVQVERNERKEALANMSKNKYWPNMELHGTDYLNQLLMYIPEDINSVSRSKGKDGQFRSFNQLAKNVKNSHAKMFDDVLNGQSFNPTSPLATQYVEDRIHTDSLSKIDSVRKVLELNQLQKKYYQKQLNKEKKGVVLPLIQRARAEHKKATDMPTIKILPSRRLYQTITLADMIADSRAFPDQIVSASASAGFYANTPTLPSQSGVSGYGSKYSRETEEDEVTPQIVLFSYKFFWTFNSLTNTTLWKPGTREGHSLTACGKYLVLYGGISTHLLGDTAVYDISRSMWTQPKLTGEIPNTGRHGHTAIEYKKSVIFFGGELQFNPTLNFRECMNDTRMFSPERNEWKFLKPSSHPISPRRYHAATVFGRDMYVYGGILNEGTFVRDVWSFNLKNYTWNQVEVEGDRETGLAFHQMVGCYIDRSNASSAAKERPKITEEGLYVFGGKDTDGKYPNTIKVLPVGNKEYKWKYIQTKGSIPIGRINFSMMFYEPMGVIIMYGGRNDTLYQSSNDFCLNELRIFNLDQMAWSPVTSFGDVPRIGRYHHQAAYSGTKLYIFGGCHSQTFTDDELRSIELNQSEVKRQLKMQTDLYSQEDMVKSTLAIEPKSPLKQSTEPKDLQLQKRMSIMPPKPIAVDSPVNSSMLRSKNFISFQPLPLSKVLSDQPDMNNSGKKKESPLKSKFK